MNLDFYDKVFQLKALAWWKTLSINEQKALEKKYKTIYSRILRNEITEIYYNESIKNTP